MSIKKTVTAELCQKLFEQMENKMEALKKQMDKSLINMKEGMTEEVGRFYEASN